MVNIKTLSDIKNLITNQIEENSQLEYKSGEALKHENKKEIIKDISAMANSAGGIIIYGVKEFDKEKNHLPEKITAVKRKDYSKEWLDQIISSSVQPKLKNVGIEPISIDTEDVVYVITVPQGNTAHQSLIDNKYYKRRNFLTEPMEDYEIRDIMNRRKEPNIILKFIIEQEKFYEQSVFDSIPLYTPTKKSKEIITRSTLIAKMYNEGEVLAEYVNCFIKIPYDILNTQEYGYNDIEQIDSINYIEFYEDNTIRDIIGMKGTFPTSYPQYGPTRFDPILPKVHSHSKKYLLNDNFSPNEKPIFWKVYADNSTVKTGKIKISEVEIKKIDSTKKVKNDN